MSPRVLTGMTLLPLLVVSFLPLGQAQQAFYPVAIPLAVRSPYLSCWLPLSNGSAWNQTLPTASDLSQVCSFLQPRCNALIPPLFQDLGWSVLVRVDSLTYRFLGAPEQPFVDVNVMNMAVTPTQTVISAQAGPMQVNLTFLNPIEVRLEPSIPFRAHSHILQSLVIGSNNRYRSRTFLSLQYQ